MDDDDNYDLGYDRSSPTTDTAARVLSWVGLLFGIAIPGIAFFSLPG
jgi:hypothetical protein